MPNMGMTALDAKHSLIYSVFIWSLHLLKMIKADPIPKVRFISPPTKKEGLTGDKPEALESQILVKRRGFFYLL